MQMIGLTANRELRKELSLLMLAGQNPATDSYESEIQRPVEVGQMVEETSF